MTTFRGSLLLLVTALAVVAAAAFRTPEADAAIDPVVEAQLVIYEINRARWDPAAFAAETNSSVPSDVLPRPPVALNQALAESATFKANEMARFGYFAHQSKATGTWPNELARDAGYPLPSWWSDNANYIESLNSGSSVPILVVGSFANSPSHRRHIFGEGTFADYVEIGVGRSDSSNYWAVHTGMRDDPLLFVTGVVYSDDNRNGRMDLGEGLPGVTVTAGGRRGKTNAGGGYSVEVANGKRIITASGGSLAGSLNEVPVKVDGFNVGVDFVSGERAVVRAYALCNGLHPTILGTNGPDMLKGTNGRDVIVGLGGADTIYGLGGNDVICGGGGGDIIDGGDGDDRIRGGSGTDLIEGGAGRNRLSGGRGNDLIVASAADRVRGGAGVNEVRSG
ncbi:MAG: hypothetical protein WEE36_05635 [Acidimicrobiia bacterium]